MKKGASQTLPAGSTPDALKDQLSGLAQRQLDALRATLEIRLAALEAALANPDDGESLETLILDLARVATQEAEASALRACVDTKLEADTQIATTRVSAEKALEAERAAGSELRRAIEEAKEQLSRLEAQLDQERAATAEVRRAAAESERQREGERAANADLSREADEAQERSAVLARERAQAGTAHEQLSTDLAAARGDAERLERALAAAQSRLEQEQAAAADLRRVGGEARERLAALGQERAQALTAQEQVATQLSQARAAAADLERELAEVRQQLGTERASTTGAQRTGAEARREVDTERASSAELRRTIEQLEGQLSSTQSENVQLLANAGAEARQEADRERTSSEELRRTIEQLEGQLSSTQSDNVHLLTNYDTLRRDLVSAQAETQALRAELAEASKRAVGGDLDRVDAEARWKEGEARGKEAEARLEAVARERARLVSELEAARRDLAGEREGRQREVREHEDAARHKESPRAAEPREPEPQPQHHRAKKPPQPAGGIEGPARETSRYALREELAVEVDGNPCTLVDLSLGGCQVLAHTALKPNNLVRVLLPSDGKPIPCAGKVAWARLEPSARGQAIRYRAGVRFTKADASALEAFLSRHGVAM